MSFSKMNLRNSESFADFRGKIFLRKGIGTLLVISKFFTLFKLSQVMVDMQTILDESPTARLLHALHYRELEEVKEAVLAGAKTVDSEFNALECALQKAVNNTSDPGTRLAK